MAGTDGVYVKLPVSTETAANLREAFDGAAELFGLLQRFAAGVDTTVPAVLGAAQRTHEAAARAKDSLRDDAKRLSRPRARARKR